nr:MAG TPA: hypothetical protein [Caudoviricetes sp.]
MVRGGLRPGLRRLDESKIVKTQRKAYVAASKRFAARDLIDMSYAKTLRLW